ncbi:hypothetical protein K474DRAFT_1037586 [Panus rudis PR-1116 ss-1]|nr:hypothetical protein K474DRAFT_1037586 [Panus rudis PR-1116 ss-1]
MSPDRSACSTSVFTEEYPAGLRYALDRPDLRLCTINFGIKLLILMRLGVLATYISYIVDSIFDNVRNHQDL